MITVASWMTSTSVRSGLAMLINSQPDLTVVAEAGSGRRRLPRPRARGRRVLMDVRMPQMADRGHPPPAGGREGEGQRVVVLTTFDLDEYALHAIEAGASGFPPQGRPARGVLARDPHRVPRRRRHRAVHHPRLLDHLAPTLRQRNHAACAGGGGGGVADATGAGGAGADRTRDSNQEIAAGCSSPRPR
jgi:chemotaxis response regulator CheB